MKHYATLIAVTLLVAASCTTPPTYPPDTTSLPSDELCAEGEFSESGERPCTPAPPGTFASGRGSTEATPCQLGKYQPDSGQGQCLFAPIGSYVDVEGATGPTGCPPGQTTTRQGSTSVDDCQVAGATLAVAYSNLDSQPGYDESGLDRMISKLVDSDNSGYLSVGDTITFGEYPLSFAATQFGAFTGSDITVSEIVSAPEGVTYVKSGGFAYNWSTMEAGFEAFAEYPLTGPVIFEDPAVSIADKSNSESDDDILYVIPGGLPSAAAIDIGYAFTLSDTDDNFLNVDIVRNPCGAGTYSVDGFPPCLPAPIGSYVEGSGATVPTYCPAAHTTEAQRSTGIDDCVSSEGVLAVAYSNLDGEPGFEEGGTDRLIAKIMDTNADSEVSGGDTVYFGEYPLDFDSSSFGSFNGEPVVIDAANVEPAGSIVGQLSRSVMVQRLGGDSPIIWADVIGYGERFVETKQGSDAEPLLAWLGVVDGNAEVGQGQGFADVIRADPTGGVSGPDTAVLPGLTRPGTTDDDFLEVDLFI